MEAKAVLKKLIVKKLIRANVWGGKSTPLDFVVKGIPEHFRNTPKGKKAFENGIKGIRTKAVRDLFDKPIDKILN